MKKHIRSYKFKRIFAMLLVLTIVLATGCSSQTNNQTSSSNSTNTEDKASTTPLGKYNSLVTYTLGKMTASDPRMPDGDTWENNAYTRYIKEKLNIQNIDSFEANGGPAYDQKVALAIASETIPDVMIVSDVSTVKQLVENDMVEDLTNAYKLCTTDRIKDIYNSYDGIFDDVTFDGKLMALPSTNISSGCELLWLRKDWMDKLGLSDPKTLDDVENIIQQFIDKDPGGNGEGKTIGLVATSDVCGAYGREYSLDPIFGLYGAYPKHWIKGSSGEVIYGSTAPEMKPALAKLAEMYKKGLLDKQFAIRTEDDISGLLINGTCGAFFGPWWAAKSPLINCYKQNKNANWQPYIAPLDENGKLKTYSQQPAYEWVVVRKGYEHPEVIMKIVSLIFDYQRYTDKDATEINEYVRKGVTRNTIPININVDYNDAVVKLSEHVSAALKNPSKVSSLLSLEKSYYDACKSYVDNPESATPDAWANYVSRITASSLCKSDAIQEIKPVFFGQTESMKLKWANLEKLEQETFLKIITGESPVNAFDNFVEAWNAQGGREITEEVRQIVNSKK